MSKAYWIAASVLFIITILLVLAVLRPTWVVTPPACRPDIPVRAGLLTASPARLADVAGVIPLGNLNPGDMHVLPVDHMYLRYPFPAGGGGLSYPVYNMAAGELFMLFRQQVPGRPDYDYQLFIEHTCSVHSYLDHLHGLSPEIETHLTDHSATWLDLGGGGSGPWIMFLGQSGGAPKMPLAAADQVGVTKNYSSAWDVGVVDTRFTNGTFANPSANRYPTYSDYAPLFPALAGVDLSIYNFGNKMRNGACFIDYLDNSSGMQSAWHAKLDSTPKGCGTIGWDVPGRLRGAWFNPALDALPAVAMDYETAALSIVLDNVDPTRVQIGIGNAAGGTTTPSLALLDPANWTPPLSAPQIANPFRVAMNPTAGAVVNPDPVNVGPGTTVCYDLAYASGYNTLLLRMIDAERLSVKYDPTPHATAQCASIESSFPPVDSSWKTYIR